MKREELLAMVAKTLRDEGADPGNSIHSWRCEHPDRYGPCQCVEDTAAELLDRVLSAAAGLIEAMVAPGRSEWAMGYDDGTDDAALRLRSLIEEGKTNDS